jgi:putative effector of murein hydrolase LrgA (UPF0299 family)
MKLSLLFIISLLFYPRSIAQVQYFEVYNSVGMKILIPYCESNREIIELDFRGFAKGIYQIHFVENGQTIKICVI